MGFVVRSSPEKMYAGQIIEYRVSPILGLPLRWITEITHCEVGKSFVDEQRFGPYKFWHHTHHFVEKDGAAEMKDVVRYMLPMGFVGKIANALFVENRLRAIFDYRYLKVEEVFGKRGE